MVPDRWKRVEEIYYSVLDSPPEQRVAVLQERCGVDSELQTEVESLLEADKDAGDFLAPDALHSHLTTFGDGDVTGTTIGPYEVQERLGAGAMGEVYRARDSRLDRLVALKILPSQFMNDAGRVARFRMEAKAASALNHSNIVTIYEIGEASGRWFIAQELVEGATLRDRMAAGAVSAAEAVAIAERCASALDAAHGARIIHRDIKPENIMIRNDGVVKLVDFGLARISEGGPELTGNATETGMILGTPRYMSPEQARGSKLDARSDIFSLAAVIYEMLHGKPAFPGSTSAEIFTALLSVDPAMGASPLDRALGRALEKDPAARYQSIGEFADALRSLDPDEKAPWLRRLPVNRKVAWWIAAAAGVLAIVTAGIFWRPWGAPTGSDAPIDTVALTTFGGLKDFAALSPTGDRIAFSWNGGREGVLKRHIYVQPVPAGEPVQLTRSLDDDIWPAWSPDGKEIAFLRRSGTGYSTVIVPSSGGLERVVVEDGGDCVGWSRDGGQLVLARNSHPRGGGLYTLSLADGRQQTLTDPGVGIRDHLAAYSPDGRWIAFLRSTRGEPEVYVIPSTGGVERGLTSDSKPKAGVTWTADSREVVYSTRRESGGAGIWRISLDGGQPRWLSNALQFAGNPHITPVGGRLAYTESRTDSNLYRFTRSSSETFDSGKRIVSSSREDHSPAYSPDGERVVFVSNRTGYSELWTSRDDGSNQFQLTDLRAFAGTPRWSPDGKLIAFDFLMGGNFEIFVISPDGGAARRLTDNSAHDSKPSFSPDSSTIYFTSNRTGAYELWAMNREGSDLRQVTKTGAREGIPAPDGRSIYLTHGPSGSAIWQLPLDGGAAQPVEALSEYKRVGRAWGAIKSGIYFLSAEPEGSEQTIRFYDFATRRVVPLRKWQSNGMWTGPVVAMSPDGKALLVAQTDHQVNDLMLIEKFR